MKDFLRKIGFGAVGALLLVPVVVGVRLWFWDRDLRAEYTLPENVIVVCSGNSHTGCTFADSPESGLRTLWGSSTPVWFSLMRLQTLERFNNLDRLSAFVIDFDVSSLSSYERKLLRYLVRCNPSLVWRQSLSAPIGVWKMLVTVGEEALSGWSVRKRESASSARDGKNWTQRTAAERRQNIDFSQQVWSLDNPRMIPGWRERALADLAEIRRICDRHQVRLILHASPLSSDFPLRTDPSKRCLLDEIVEQVRGLGYEWHDFTAACPDVDFRDCGHLHPEAARRFTEWFLREVLKRETPQ